MLCAVSVMIPVSPRHHDFFYKKVNLITNFKLTSLQGIDFRLHALHHVYLLEKYKEDVLLTKPSILWCLSIVLKLYLMGKGPKNRPRTCVWLCGSNVNVETPAL